MQYLVKNLRANRAFDRQAGTIVVLSALGAALFAGPASSGIGSEPAPMTAAPAHAAAARPAAQRVLAPTVRALPLLHSPALIAPQVRVASAILPAHLLPVPKAVKAGTGRHGAAHTTLRSMDDVTLDFASADINDVLKALAMQTGANIVSGSDVKGTITVSLAHVSLDEALNIISKLSGYQYAKVGSTYLVGSPANISALAQSGTATTPATTAVLTFNYADPAYLTQTITDRYPNVKATTGKAAAGGAGGVIVVTGTEADVEAVRQLIIDSELALSKGVSASQTVVYRVKYASPADLQTVLARLVPGLVVTPGPIQGFNLNAPVTADAGGTTSTTAQFGAAAAVAAVSATSNLATKATTTSLLLTGSDSDIARAETLLAQIDLRPAQINFETKVTEINLNSAKNIGLTYDFSGATTTIGEALQPGETPGSATLKAVYPGHILKGLTFARTPIDQFVRVGLNALFTNGNAKLLADPNISALDGQQAAVFIGDTVRYVSSITQTPTGQNVTTDSVNVGIKLFVTGKISSDGYVTLNIHPEVSTITSFLPVPGGGSLPEVGTREATTTLRVKDGETIAIGGLINEQDTKNIQKVPFFGDLPFFGNLFRNTTHNHTRDEVVIFVKVSIAKDAV